METTKPEENIKGGGSLWQTFQTYGLTLCEPHGTFLDHIFEIWKSTVIQSFLELEIDAMCCVWPDERGYLYIYRCCGASGGGGGGGGRGVEAWWV